MIGGDLEYLMNSLPYLSFGRDEALKTRVTSLLRSYAGPGEQDASLDTILDAEARKFLSPARYDRFSGVKLDNVHDVRHRQGSNKVLSEFSTYTHSLKTALRDMRVQRRKSGRGEAPAGVQLPIEPGSPLEEELQILKLLWNEADELSAGHFSDYEALLTYKLKLMILMRLWGFDAKLGYEIYSNLAQNN